MSFKLVCPVLLLILLSNISDAFTCEKVCSQKNHYRKEPARLAQVSLRTPAALGKTKMTPKVFKRSSVITEFDLPGTQGAQQTVIVREGLV